jgi:hypothetical protein
MNWISTSDPNQYNMWAANYCHVGPRQHLSKYHLLVAEGYTDFHTMICPAWLREGPSGRHDVETFRPPNHGTYYFVGGGHRYSYTHPGTGKPYLAGDVRLHKASSDYLISYDRVAPGNSSYRIVEDYRQPYLSRRNNHDGFGDPAGTNALYADGRVKWFGIDHVMTKPTGMFDSHAPHPPDEGGFHTTYHFYMDGVRYHAYWDRGRRSEYGRRFLGGVNP